VIQNDEAYFEQFVLQIFPGENINNIKAALDKECGDGKGVLAFRNTMTQIIHQIESENTNILSTQPGTAVASRIPPSPQCIDPRPQTQHQHVPTTPVTNFSNVTRQSPFNISAPNPNDHFPNFGTRIDHHGNLFHDDNSYHGTNCTLFHTPNSHPRGPTNYLQPTPTLNLSAQTQSTPQMLERTKLQIPSFFMKMHLWVIIQHSPSLKVQQRKMSSQILPRKTQEICVICFFLAHQML